MPTDEYYMVYHKSYQKYVDDNIQIPFFLFTREEKDKQEPDDQKVYKKMLGLNNPETCMSLLFASEEDKNNLYKNLASICCDTTRLYHFYGVLVKDELTQEEIDNLKSVNDYLMQCVDNVIPIFTKVSEKFRFTGRISSGKEKTLSKLFILAANTILKFFMYGGTENTCEVRDALFRCKAESMKLKGTTDTNCKIEQHALGAHECQDIVDIDKVRVRRSTLNDLADDINDFVLNSQN